MKSTFFLLKSPFFLWFHDHVASPPLGKATGPGGRFGDGRGRSRFGDVEATAAHLDLQHGKFHLYEHPGAGGVTIGRG